MLQFLLDELHSVANPSWLEGMKRYDIASDHAIGVSMPALRSIATSFNKINSKPDRHKAAIELWETGIHEARILASIIDHPSEVGKTQMNKWTNDFNSWDLCDQVCSNLFQKTPFLLEKAFEYSKSKKEFVKRTGFVLMVQYAVHHKKSDDAVCVDFLKRIEEEANDDRNFVRKAVNWCLRSIGKRNKYLHKLAIESAERILLQNTQSVKWIANDALRELRSEGVLKRF